MDSSERFETWAVVEVFGHQKYAGFVSEQAIGGTSLVRVDVPELPAENSGEPSPAFTKLFGAAAIYSITPVSEAVARVAAARIRATPVNVWMPELHPQPEPRSLPPGADHHGEIEDEDEDETYHDDREVSGWDEGDDDE